MRLSSLPPRMSLHAQYSPNLSLEEMSNRSLRLISRAKLNQLKQMPSRDQWASEQLAFKAAVKRRRKHVAKNIVCLAGVP